MPRRIRLNLTHMPQHIIQRGNNRSACFYAEQDYRFYLGCLFDASRKYGCLVYACVLTTNHVHLLASAQQLSGLSRMMQHLDRRFVQYINDVYRRSGTLWEGRFRASLVDTETYFLRCRCYIERALRCAAHPPKRGRPTRSMVPDRTVEQSEPFG